MHLLRRTLRQVGGIMNHMWKSSSTIETSSVTVPLEEQQHFKLKMALTNYSPEEVKIKVVNGYLVIEGKHEEAGPNGRTTKEFTKWLKVPDDVDVNTLEHKLSSDGILNLTARKKITEEPAALPQPSVEQPPASQ